MVAIDYDPLALHYVASLARPDGNVTGVFFQQVELAMKRLQLMKNALPNVEAATVFWDGSSADQWQASQRAGATLGLRGRPTAQAQSGERRRGARLRAPLLKHWGGSRQKRAPVPPAGRGVSFARPPRN